MCSELPLVRSHCTSHGSDQAVLKEDQEEQSRPPAMAVTWLVMGSTRDPECIEQSSGGKALLSPCRRKGRTCANVESSSVETLETVITILLGR